MRVCDHAGFLNPPVACSGNRLTLQNVGEALSHSLLASNKLAPALLARFENGLLYRFIEGSACSPADLRRPEVWPATARRLGQWHGILPTADAVATAGTQEKKWSSINQLLPGKPVPNVWTVMQKWIFALPGHTESEKKRNETLQQELEDSTKRLGHANGLDKGRYVLSHCDLLSGNVIVHPKTNQGPKSATDVSFIDYEYTTPAPAAFDLANHFAEWGGFECDYNVLPTRAQRRAFLKEYVVSYRAHLKDKSNHFNNHNSTTSIAGDEQDVEKLFKEVNEFRGIPGLYWGIWALIQAMISQIDFDYASYAKTRLQEYWDWKAHVQGSQKDTQIRLRERRWAQEE